AQVLPIWEGTTSVLSLDALRTVARPGVAEAYLAELERLGSPGRDAVAARLHQVVGEGPEAAQRSARTLATAMAEAWISGLLHEAAGRGGREAAVAELWESGCEPAAADPFELVVDGAA